MGCAVGTLFVPLNWVKQISIDSGMDFGSQKRPNSGPVCQGKKAPTVSLVAVKKLLNQFFEKCPNKSVGCELECPCGKFDIA